jgi:hypothetical protein
MPVADLGLAFAADRSDDLADGKSRESPLGWTGPAAIHFVFYLERVRGTNR